MMKDSSDDSSLYISHSNENENEHGHPNHHMIFNSLPFLPNPTPNPTPTPTPTPTPLSTRLDYRSHHPFQFQHQLNWNTTPGVATGHPEPYQPALYDPFQIKHRRRTTPAQLNILEAQFETNCKPDVILRKSLAEQLDMTPREVQVWFQNRRAKTKKLEKRAEQVDSIKPTSTEPLLLQISTDQTTSTTTTTTCTTTTPTTPTLEDPLPLQSSAFFNPKNISSESSSTHFFSPLLQAATPESNSLLIKTSDLLNEPSSSHTTTINSFHHPAASNPTRNGLYQLYTLPPSFVFGTAQPPPPPSSCSASSSVLSSNDDSKDPNTLLNNPHHHPIPLGYHFDRNRHSISSSITTSDSHHHQQHLITPSTTDFNFDPPLYHDSQLGPQSHLPIGFDPRRRSSCPAEFIQSFDHFGFAPPPHPPAPPPSPPPTTSPSTSCAHSTFYPSPLATRTTNPLVDSKISNLHHDLSTLSPPTLAATMGTNPNAAIQRRHSVASILTQQHHHLSSTNNNAHAAFYSLSPSAAARRGSTSSIAVLNAIEEHPPTPPTPSSDLGCCSPPLSSALRGISACPNRPQLERRARSQANMKNASGYQAQVLHQAVAHHQSNNKAANLGTFNKRSSSSLEAMFDLDQS